MSRVRAALKSLVYVDFKRRKKWLRIEAWAAIIGVHVLLLAAWVVPGSFETTSRAGVVWTWGMMMVRVLYFQLGLLMLLIAAVAALRRHFRMAAVCVPVIVATLVTPYLHFGRGAAPPGEGRVLKVISANLLMINRNTRPILDEIEIANADIVFLQEYTEHWEEAFKRRFGEKYPHRITYPQEDSFGAAIYSRLPFVGNPDLDASMGKWSVAQLSAVVDVGGTRVECRNIHLIPPRRLDYTVEHFDEMRDFLRKLEGDKGKRVIIAGDFNFTGSTLQARGIKGAGYHDAFDEAGGGRGSTWPVNGFFRWLPGIRLDHMYLSAGLRCRRIETGTGEGSDHRPLVAEIVLEGR